MTSTHRPRTTNSGDHGRVSHQRLRIDLAYDGSGYRGFARQADVPTVQGTLEGALTRACGLLRGSRRDDGLPRIDDRVATTCAGRTDAGVHALAQVVHVDLAAAWSPAAAKVLTQAFDEPGVLRRRLDRLVGDDITIWAVGPVSGDFDARSSAGERRYRYVLSDAAAVTPLGRRARWDVREGLDEVAMHDAAQALVGEHDFASLCRRADGGHTTRRIDEIAVQRVTVPVPMVAPSEQVHLSLRGPAFCHQLVRSIAGCLVEVGTGRRPVGWMADVVAARDRSVAARVAPGRGLTLQGVAYPHPWPDAPWTMPLHPAGLRSSA